MSDVARPQPQARSGPRLRTAAVARSFPDRIALADRLSVVLLIVLSGLVVLTFRDYAITNDEWVQHRYGELILAYYSSGLTDRSFLHFDNLYLYGGLFDVLAVLLSKLSTLDLFDLRHLLAASFGIGGLAFAMATARMIGGPAAGLLTGLLLAVTGSWYGTMFHHTKDVPLAALMMGAVFFLLRLSRDLPSPRRSDVAMFGVMTGLALGIKVLALLLLCYLSVAAALHMPMAYWRSPRQLGRWALTIIRHCWPALLIAYVLMILAWPWSALAPLNPIKGLLDFGAFKYDIATVLNGALYKMSTIPPWYVPHYLGVKLPLVLLIGAPLVLLVVVRPQLIQPAQRHVRRDVAVIAMAALFPVICVVTARGPAFCGLRHFLFVVPPLAVLAGVGLVAASAAATRRHLAAGLAAALVIAAAISMNAITLIRLHPYQYITYNPIMGGLAGAYQRYVTDYWFTSMPEAARELEAYLARTEPHGGATPTRVFKVGVCGERSSFEWRKSSRLVWTSNWKEADFFLAPTHMRCHTNSDGKVIATVERLGVVIAVVKDQRGVQP